MTANGMTMLADKVVVVTGATKGLGRAAALGFAQAGATVVVTSRKQEACDATAAAITGQTGCICIAKACHVGDWDAVPAFVDHVVERTGRVDVLVNNAGIMPALVDGADIGLAYWRKIFSVNVEGPLRLSQLIAPLMRDQGGGSIINVSSISAYNGGGQGNTAYGSAKAALIAMTRNLAREWAPWGIRVNAISPGAFSTPMNDASNTALPGFYEREAEKTMLGRVGEAHEIVGPLLYLASPASSYVTGEDHLVTGGVLR
jgi:NAD(P)-dependent dehydrogenase (short-subunit alcohol dehydrogenase family)